MFTGKELKVARMRLAGLMNKDIAQELGVSEADISQTISRLTGKVKTVQDSVELLTKMGVIHEGPKYMLTDKGRRLARIPKVPKTIEVHGIVWYDFETSRIQEVSKDINVVVFWSPHILDQIQTIAALGFSAAQINAFTKKKGKMTSPTSVYAQPIEALETVVLT